MNKRLAVCSFEQFLGVVGEIAGLERATIAADKLSKIREVLDALQVLSLDMLIQSRLGVLIHDDTWLSNPTMRELYVAYTVGAVDAQLNVPRAHPQ
jgi:hypothetical protein